MERLKQLGKSHIWTNKTDPRHVFLKFDKAYNFNIFGSSAILVNINNQNILNKIGRA